jgi:predicted ATPase
MLTQLRLKNFKSWSDTGEIRLAPLTCFFGSNSSGKTSILQSLLMLRQTAESADRSSILQFGGPSALVNLGDYSSLIHDHNHENVLDISLKWTTDEEVELSDPFAGTKRGFIASGKLLGFQTQISSRNGQGKGYRQRVDSVQYLLGESSFSLTRKNEKNEYELAAQAPGFDLKRVQGRVWPLPAPIKCYGFPDQVRAYYQNAGFLSDLELALESQLKQIYYLGPLRAYPERSYSWAGGQPGDMGRSGEQAIDAILAARDRGLMISPGYRMKKVSLEAYVAKWLKEIGLIASFSVSPVSEDSQIYQVKVTRVEGGPEVLITDVGFGVSQILPVIVLCFYVPEGSTIVLEQPEIHLHPAVQAGLADVLIDATRRNKVQLIIESHSEHFLRRIQLRIAEDGINPSEVSMYFAQNQKGGSTLKKLDIDLFGDIHNWPQDFFGDMIGELVRTQKAQRKKRNGPS